MTSVALVDSELYRYAERLRAENTALRAEIAQTRVDLKNHIALSERRFQELYAYISQNAPSATSDSNEAMPLMPSSTPAISSLAAPLFG